ncbi:MAG: methyltransferase family protein [Sediminibacterium sp.]
MQKPLAYLLVVIQFSAIGWLIKSAYPFNLNLIAFVVCAIGIILGSWSLWVMRVSKIRILPMPHIEAELVTNGPYRLLRHPMYTAVLLFTAGLSIAYFYWYKVAIWLILLIILLFKLHWEEKMLMQQFANYQHYRSKSYKLIPLLY